jgi:hypothetical protein
MEEGKAGENERGEARRKRVKRVRTRKGRRGKVRGRLSGSRRDETGKAGALL